MALKVYVYCLYTHDGIFRFGGEYLPGIMAGVAGKNVTF